MNISEMKTERPDSSIESLRIKSINESKILEMEQESSGKHSVLSSKRTLMPERDPPLQAIFAKPVMT